MNNLRSRLPPLTSLAAFDAACRHASFTKAANELCLTQAAVSRQIIALEAFLDVKLFERRPHDVVLTYDGERFAKTVNPAINAIGDVTARMKSGRKNQLVIFTEPCIANYWITPRISNYQAEYPQTTIKLITSDLPIDETSEEFDIGMQYGPTSNHNFVEQANWSDEVMIVTCPDIYKMLPVNPGLADLLEFPLVHTERQGPGWVSWPDYFSSFNFDLPTDHTSLVFNNYHSSVDATIHGAGILLGWNFVVEPVIRAGRLSRVGQFSIPSPDNQFIYTRKNSRNSNSAEEFIEWVKNDLANQIY